MMMSSHLLNGTDNHNSGGGSGGGGVGNRETYQLLNLTESDSEDDGALTRLEAGEGGARKPENVPDLNLALPNDQSSRGRRKIRLKRRVVYTLDLGSGEEFFGYKVFQKRNGMDF